MKSTSAKALLYMALSQDGLANQGEPEGSEGRNRTKPLEYIKKAFPCRGDKYKGYEVGVWEGCVRKRLKEAEDRK